MSSTTATAPAAAPTAAVSPIPVETGDALRARAAKLLDAGEVVCVIGWEAGRFPGQRTPFVAKTAKDAEHLVFDEFCEQAIGKYVLEHKDEGRVGLFCRGCESRAINRMIADNQLKRENVYLLGLPCSGMADHRTGQPLKRCVECQQKNPLIHDEIIGEEVLETKANRFADVDRLESMTREERRAFFDRMYETCIRCYACRNACPCCTCRECFVEQERVGWQGKQFNIDEARFYGITRAFHVGDRCIECGECERVCPMGLPLMTLMHKQVRDIDELFGPYDGSGFSVDGPDPLRTYKTDDVEEFM